MHSTLLVLRTVMVMMESVMVVVMEVVMEEVFCLLLWLFPTS